VGTPMIGCATAVGMTILPEEQNVISVKLLVDQMQSWLNLLHGKVAVANSKVAMINSKVATVNSKVAVVNSQHTINSQHTTGHHLATEDQTIGFAANAAMIISPFVSNATSAKRLKVKQLSRARPFQAMGRANHRMNIQLIGSANHAKIRTLPAALNATVARLRERAMRPWFKIQDHRATRLRAT